MTQPRGHQPALSRPASPGDGARGDESARFGQGLDGVQTGPGDAHAFEQPAFGPAEEFRDLPEATVARLPEYLRALHSFAEAGHETVSSEALAAAAGVNSAKLRKDLSHLGSYGTRGVGYDVAVLVGQIESVLGLTQRRAVALIGVGNLGHALAGYAGFTSRGFRFAALLDADPARVGERINGVAVQHIDDIDIVVRDQAIAIAVIATPVHAAQAVADRLVAAGITSILNFAPCVLTVPDGVDVRKVDLAVELQILSFHERRKASAAEPRSGEARAASSTAATHNTAAEPRSGEARAASSTAATHSTAGANSTVPGSPSPNGAGGATRPAPAASGSGWAAGEAVRG